MAKERWGSNTEGWGSQVDNYGTQRTQPFVADQLIAAHAISLEYPDDTAFHVWTGFDDITLGGITYTAVGPNIISIGVATTEISGQGGMTISLSAIDPEHRVKFLQDPGRVLVTLRLLYSSDGGVTWQFIPRFHRGELSRPQLQGGTYTIEISPYRDTLDRGFDQNWSHENQQQEYPGDLGFEHLTTLTDGVDIRWP